MSKSKENIYGKYNDVFKDEINTLLKKREFKPQKSFTLFTDEGLFGMKITPYIVKYFECSNGYVGFDRTVINYNSYHLIFWFCIFTSKDTTLREKNIASTEIMVFFYQWLGAFYSLKEKLLAFIGAKIKKDKILFDSTCLSKLGQKKIRELFSRDKELLKLFSVRNRIIHDAYDIEFCKEKLQMIIKHFGFNLQIENDIFQQKFVLDINKDYISACNNSAVELISEYIDIITSLEFIDIDKFKMKYTNTDGKLYISY